MVADSKARDELRASETNRNKNSSEAAVSGVLDAVGAADYLLARFLMTVCIGSGYQSVAAAATVESAAAAVATQNRFTTIA